MEMGFHRAAEIEVELPREQVYHWWRQQIHRGPVWGPLSTRYAGPDLESEWVSEWSSEQASLTAFLESSIVIFPHIDNTQSAGHN